MRRWYFAKTAKSYSVLLMVLIVLVILSVVLAISFGAVNIPLSDTIHILAGKLIRNERLYAGLGKSHVAIVWNMRVPRVILGGVVGAGLALCGCALQATVNNPISEPYILGVSAGATFGATLFIILGFSLFTAVGAFAGAMLATVTVLAIASAQGKMTTSRLILSGTVVNALFSAFSNFIISVAGNSDNIMTIKFWTMGSLANAKWSDLPLPVLVISISGVFLITQYRVFDTMMLGDEVAVTLGINLGFFRKIYMLVVAIMTGILVSSCGIIGFVGLIIPHLSRSFVGSNHRRLLPVAALIGSVFLIWADVFARILVENAELPIGIFTALVGAPFFIYIVTRRGYGRE